MPDRAMPDRATPDRAVSDRAVSDRLMPEAAASRPAMGDGALPGRDGGDHAVATFMGVELLVNADVLAPREETTLLGRAARDVLARRAGAQIVVDMCCGCGNLALALATHCPRAFVYACDLTPGATSVASMNAKRNGLDGRVAIRRGDLFGALADERLQHQVDLVVCNPPYISTARLAGDRAHLLESEPREAFDGGPYGISILQRLVREAADHLKPGGWLAFEFGEGQERQARLLLDRAGRYDSVALLEDAQGRPRVALARRRTDA